MLLFMILFLILIIKGFAEFTKWRSLNWFIPARFIPGLHHSLGAYHLMCNALHELKSKGTVIYSEEEQAAKIAILLHDIGHGPYSHALENILIKEC